MKFLVANILWTTENGYSIIVEEVIVIQMKKLIKFLEDRITDRMPLEDIVMVFEEMCNMHVKEDMILFETGTFSFTGEPLFYFSVIRQLPNEEEEFCQIHMEVLYKPTNENKTFSETTWNEEISENIFDYIRESQAFAFCKNEEYIKVKIYLDET